MHGTIAFQNKLSFGLTLLALSFCALPADAATTTDTTPATTAGSAPTTSAPQSVTAQNLNQNINGYLGKQVVLNGKVDRALGNGAYIVQDTQSSGKASDHRILVFTSAPTPPAQAPAQNGTDTKSSKQQAGMMPLSLKEGDKLQLQGKVEQFNMSNEVDTFSPKSDQETINASAMSVPVLVVQPSQIHPAG